jgi:hypothetical protein
MIITQSDSEKYFFVVVEFNLLEKRIILGSYTTTHNSTNQSWFFKASIEYAFNFCNLFGLIKGVTFIELLNLSKGRALLPIT